MGKKRWIEKQRFLMSTTTNLVMLTLTAFLFSSCMAAIPIMMAAHAGLAAHSITKTVQMSTDGNVEMAIGENEVAGAGKNKLVLSEISKLAVWPDEGMVLVADELQKSKVFTLIATPSKSGKVIDQIGFDRKLASLTYSEKMLAFQEVCKGTQTEAIVVFEDLGHQANMRMWSFSRSSLDFRGKIIIFELRTNQVIFSSITEMKINLGGNSPNQREIMKRGSKMLAQKIIELKQGETLAKK
ncbi:MAG: hypothetical protein U9P50_02435 [Patescibacteria group bacterium]|nr:hypothetical protein [Patescibacteria group bacterium]